MLNNQLLSPMTESTIQEAAAMYRDKLAFDAYVELYKLGLISEKSFVNYAKQFISFTPDKTLLKARPD